MRPVRRTCRGSWRSRRRTSSSRAGSMAGGRRAGRRRHRSGRGRRTRTGVTRRDGRTGGGRGAGGRCVEAAGCVVAGRGVRRSAGRGSEGGRRTGSRCEREGRVHSAIGPSWDGGDRGRRRGRRGRGGRSPFDGEGALGRATAQHARAKAQQGDARFHVVRRRRGSVRARLAWRQLVRHDERHVLDAQPEGIRRPAQARARVPGTRPARDEGQDGGHARRDRDRRDGRDDRGDRDDRDRRARRRRGCEPATRRPPRGFRPSDPHDEFVVGIHRRRNRPGARR